MNDLCQDVVARTGVELTTTFSDSGEVYSQLLVKLRHNMKMS